MSSGFPGPKSGLGAVRKFENLGNLGINDHSENDYQNEMSSVRMIWMQKYLFRIFGIVVNFSCINGTIIMIMIVCD